MESAELDQLRERVAQLEVQQQQRDGLMGALNNKIDTKIDALESRVNDRIDGAEARLRSELTKIRNGQESQMEALAALLQRSSDGDGGLPEPERRQQFLRQNRPHMTAKLEGYACGELKAAEYSAQEVKAAGYLAQEAFEAGFRDESVLHYATWPYPGWFWRSELTKIRLQSGFVKANLREGESW